MQNCTFKTLLWDHFIYFYSLLFYLFYLLGRSLQAVSGSLRNPPVIISQLGQSFTAVAEDAMLIRACSDWGSSGLHLRCSGYRMLLKTNPGEMLSMPQVIVLSLGLGTILNSKFTSKDCNIERNWINSSYKGLIYVQSRNKKMGMCMLREDSVFLPLCQKY